MLILEKEIFYVFLQDAGDLALNLKATDTTTSNTTSAADIEAMEVQVEDCDDGDLELLEDIVNEGNWIQSAEQNELPKSIYIAVQVDYNKELTNDNAVAEKIKFCEAQIIMQVAKVSCCVLVI